MTALTCVCRGALEFILAESAIELRAGYPKCPSRSRLVAGDLAHRLLNRLLLEVAEIGTSQRWSIIPVGERQMLGVNRRSFVPWPVIGEQRLLGARRQLRVPVVTTLNALEEVLGKQQDVRASLA